ncbi:hypothetical protein BGX21_007825, partial [Mortierella sp. AD011]
MMEPRYGTVASVSDYDLIQFVMVLVGAVSLSRNYLDSASACTNALGPFVIDFSSWDSARGSLLANRFQKRAGLDSGRVGDIGDYICVVREIEYEFRDKLLLEDALSQSKSRGAATTQQGLNCQRLELLGDAVLDILSIGYWLDGRPGTVLSALSLAHVASTNREVLAVAA